MILLKQLTDDSSKVIELYKVQSFVVEKYCYGTVKALGSRKRFHELLQLWHAPTTRILL